MLGLDFASYGVVPDSYMNCLHGGANFSLKFQLANKLQLKTEVRMGNYVICPDRDGKKVSLEVCVRKCELKDICEKYLEATTKAKEPEVENLETPTAQAEDSDVKPEEASDPGKGQAKILNPPAVPTKRAKELYDKVLSLKSQIEVKWFQLGKVLEEIFEGKHYISLGYHTWKHFCEEALKPLDLKWRAADYLRTTRLKCDEIGSKRRWPEKLAGQS